MTLTLLAYHSDPTAMVEPSQDRGRVSRLGMAVARQVLPIFTPRYYDNDYHFY